MVKPKSTDKYVGRPNNINLFTAICSKMLLFEAFSAILV